MIRGLEVRKRGRLPEAGGAAMRLKMIMVILAYLAEVGGNILHLWVKLDVSKVYVSLQVHITSDLLYEGTGIILLLFFQYSRALSY